MTPVQLEIKLPNLAAQWMMGNSSTLLAELGDRWPGCAEDLTDEMRLGLELSQKLYNLDVAAIAERMRMESQVVMAAAFDQVDFIMAATNPGPAFAAEATTSKPEASPIDGIISNPVGSVALRGVLGLARAASTVIPDLPNKLIDIANDRDPGTTTMGGLTIISNLYGNPAVSIPSGTIDGLPVGLQVLGRHHEDALLFDVALASERHRPWPLVAPRPLT